MTYLHLAYMHLLTVMPAFLIGTHLMFARKGSRHHKAIGRIYLLLLFATSVVTLFMPAAVGPRLLGHFGYTHLLSVLALITVPVGYYAARTHRVALHRYNMIGLYVGGILIAGFFAFMPGRMLHAWLFGAPF